MTVERTLLPFSTEPLRGERLLVLAPHPDDEIIGCGGLIALHAAEGRKILVIIATDGSASDPDEPGLPERRAKESSEGLRSLGASEPRFLNFRDRGLAEERESLQRVLREAIEEWQPDLIAAPSPIEIHPDHAALAHSLVDLIQRDPEIRGRIAVCRVAFYEVSHPIRPNTLVDISAVAETKYKALRAHTSQVGLRNYELYARGLNQYRTMSLPAGVTAAEGYFVVPLPELHRTAWGELTRNVGGTSPLRVTESAQPVSVIVRTKNRPALLHEAIASIQANNYPSEIIVVNDGGPTLASTLPAEIRLIEHSESKGRSEAMNEGVRNATSDYLAFLDDDDLFFNDHLQTLMTAATTGAHVACYTDAVSSFMSLQSDGTWKESSRHRFYAHEYDRELLLFDNYIPLTTLLVRRESYLAVGGFDPSFDLFEDWDFLLRLSKKGGFLRVPSITCAIRHYPDSGSLILESPERSPSFERARQQLWTKHAQELTHERIASVFSRQKERIGKLFSDALEQRGRASHLEQDIERLSREKESLLSRLAKVQEELRSSADRIAELGSRVEAGAAELRRTYQENQELAAERERQNEQVGELFAEIERLNSILQEIYRSRTWKLHRLVEGVKRKGG